MTRCAARIRPHTFALSGNGSLGGIGGVGINYYFCTLKFECGAKLTMISDTEFSVSELRELSLPYPWQNVARIKFKMKPSISLIKKSSGETESRIYDGGEGFPINLCLFDDCYFYPDE